MARFSGRLHPHRTRRRPPSQSATAHACCPSPAPPQEHPAPSGNTQRTPPCRRRQRGRPKHPEYPGDTSGYHPPTPRRPGEYSDASSPAGTPHANRKGGKTRAHQLLRRGSGQRAGGGKLAQESAAAGAVHLAARAGAAVVMIQFSHANQYRERAAPRKPRVKKAQRQEGTAQRNARSAGGTNPPAERTFLFSIVKFERTYMVRISGNAYSAIARAGVSAAEGLPTYAPRYLAAGWLSATLVWPLPKMFSRRVLPSYSVR